jgi:hypothetical protein
MDTTKDFKVVLLGEGMASSEAYKSAYKRRALF